MDWPSRGVVAAAHSRISSMRRVRHGAELLALKTGTRAIEATRAVRPPGPAHSATYLTTPIGRGNDLGHELTMLGNNADRPCRLFATVPQDRTVDRDLSRISDDELDGMNRRAPAASSKMAGIPCELPGGT